MTERDPTAVWNLQVKVYNMNKEIITLGDSINI